MILFGGSGAYLMVTTSGRLTPALLPSGGVHGIEESFSVLLIALQSRWMRACQRTGNSARS